MIGARLWATVPVILLRVGLALASACEGAGPVPPNKLEYVGTWEGEGMTLSLKADGHIDYQSEKGWVSTGENGSYVTSYEPSGFTIRWGWFFRALIRVDRPPHREGGQWTMTVEGTVLVRQEPEPPRSAIPLLVVILVAAVAWLAVRWRRLRILRAVAMRPLESLVGGSGAAGGWVTPIEPLITAPVSGRPCVGYHLRVTDDEGAIVVDVHEMPAFWLTDQTGRVLVPPDHRPWLHLGSRRPRAVPPRTSFVLQARYGFMAAVGALSYTEDLLVPDDRVVVCGRVIEEPSGNSTCLVLRATAHPSLIVTPFADLARKVGS